MLPLSFSMIIHVFIIYAIDFIDFHAMRFDIFFRHFRHDFLHADAIISMPILPLFRFCFAIFIFADAISPLPFHLMMPLFADSWYVFVDRAFFFLFFFFFHAIIFMPLFHAMPLFAIISFSPLYAAFAIFRLFAIISYCHYFHDIDATPLLRHFITPHAISPWLLLIFRLLFAIDFRHISFRYWCFRYFAAISFSFSLFSPADDSFLHIIFFLFGFVSPHAFFSTLMPADFRYFHFFIFDAAAFRFFADISYYYYFRHFAISLFSRYYYFSFRHFLHFLATFAAFISSLSLLLLPLFHYAAISPYFIILFHYFIFDIFFLRSY